MACLVGVLLGFARPVLAEERELVITGVDGHLNHIIAAAVIKAAYERADIPLRLRWVPAKRALNEANIGVSDGDVGRIAGTEKIMTNLVQVPTPVTNFKGVVFTIHVEDRGIREWADLKPYRIAVLRGVLYSEIGTEGMNREIVNTTAEMMRLLVKNHVDVVVETETYGVAVVAREFPKEGIRIIGAPLYEASVYHYLNRKNRDLIEPLDRALRQMTATGEIVEIRRRAMETMIASY